MEHLNFEANDFHNCTVYIATSFTVGSAISLHSQSTFTSTWSWHVSTATELHKNCTSSLLQNVQPYKKAKTLTEVQQNPFRTRPPISYRWKCTYFYIRCINWQSITAKLVLIYPLTLFQGIHVLMTLNVLSGVTRLGKKFRYYLDQRPWICRQIVQLYTKYGETRGFEVFVCLTIEMVFTFQLTVCCNKYHIYN